MNERIVELAKQCASEDHLAIYGGNYAKFAELIVRECCQMMLDLEVKYPANLTVREIKKHFGVDK